MAAYTISEPKDPVKGLFFCFVFIVLATIIVILWRKSLKLFEIGYNKLWILLLSLNLILSILPLIYSMNVLLDTGDNVKIENVEPQIDQYGN